MTEAHVYFTYRPVDCSLVRSRDDFENQLKSGGSKYEMNIHASTQFSDKRYLPQYLADVVDNRLKILLLFGKCRECRNVDCEPENAETGGRKCECTLSRLSSTGSCGKNCVIPVEMNYAAIAGTVLR